VADQPLQSASGEWRSRHSLPLQASFTALRGCRPLRRHLRRRRRVSDIGPV